MRLHVSPLIGSVAPPLLADKAFMRHTCARLVESELKGRLQESRQPCLPGMNKPLKAIAVSGSLVLIYRGHIIAPGVNVISRFENVQLLTSQVGVST